mmetsp:Transcript_47161/g.132968  ORF Transcript_47161/g.132968 Transcript_47161/m.132968 type:complete len:230 (-) Transcript_47161:401-1090(-)
MLRAKKGSSRVRKASSSPHRRGTGAASCPAAPASVDADLLLGHPLLRPRVEDDPEDVGRREHPRRDGAAVHHACGEALLHVFQGTHPPAAVSRHVHPQVLVHLVLVDGRAVRRRLALAVVEEPVHLLAGDILELDHRSLRHKGLRLLPPRDDRLREQHADRRADLAVLLLPDADVLRERARHDRLADDEPLRHALVLARGGAQPPAPIDPEEHPLLRVRPALVHRRLRG